MGSKLADDHLDRIGGQKDKADRLVQEKYGYARDHETGAMDWILLWAFGIPIPILIGLFMVRGCT